MSPTTSSPRCQICGLEMVREKVDISRPGRARLSEMIDGQWVCPEESREPVRLRDILYPHRAVANADPEQLRDLLKQLQEFMSSAKAPRTVDRSNG